MKIVLMFLLSLSFFISGIIFGYYISKLEIKSKVCPVSLEEGLNKLFEDFPEQTVYFEDFSFTPWKEGSVVVRRIRNE